MLRLRRLTRPGPPGPTAAGLSDGFRPLEAVRPIAGPDRSTDSIADIGFAAARGVVALRDIFTPSRPRDPGPLFIGRTTELRRMVDAVEIEAAHIVLYGARGLGKTSLANAFAALATAAGQVTLRRACGVETSYSGLFRALLLGVPGRLLGLSGAGSAAELLPPGDFGPAEVSELLGRLQGARLLLVIDEFDRAQAVSLRDGVAETIKNLSDQATPVTLLVVGVAATLQDLLGRQPSIQRNLVTLHLPPMQPADVSRIATAGATAAGLRWDSTALEMLVRLARGLPHQTQLLCLHAAAAATRRDAAGAPPVIGLADLAAAAAEAQTKFDPELVAAWRRATALPGGEAALVAAAQAPTDADDRFDPAALPAALAPALEALAAAPAGHVLVAEGGCFGFVEPRLRHYALLRSFAAGTLAEPMPGPSPGPDTAAARPPGMLT